MTKARYRPTYREVVGQNVRRARLARGWTQALLGAEIERYLGEGWPKQIVSAIEQGGRGVDADELVALGFALGVPVTELLRPIWNDDDKPVVRVGATAEKPGQPIAAWLLRAATEMQMNRDLLNEVDRLIRDATRFRDRAQEMAKQQIRDQKGAGR